MCVGLNIAQKQLHSLIDTGASRSLVRYNTWLEICRFNHQTPILQKGEILRSLSGHELHTMGRTSMYIEGRSVSVYVVRDLFHDILLGGDALEILETDINYKTKSVTLGGTKYDCKDASNKDESMGEVQTEAEKWEERFPEVFSTKGGLKCTNNTVMEIDTGNAEPIKQRPYRIPLRKRKVVEEEIDKMLAEGIIEPSTSPWASPITLVPKKDGEVRFCIDFRKLNSVTKSDAGPIPHVQDILDNLSGASVFSLMDLKQGYWQVKMSEGSKEKTGFCTHRGLYHFNRMPFGLKSSAPHFQRLMNQVLSKYIGKFVMVYIDDIIVYSKSDEEHENHLSLVFEALQAAQLTVKASKCAFRQKQVKLLGYIVSAEGISADPEKVRAIAEMAPPTDVKGIKSFLGMCSYYRQCIPDFSKIAKPLNELTKKYTRFQWGSSQQEAWELLRNHLVSQNIMKFPELDKEFLLYTDACDYAIGAILCQKDDQGVERPIQYISKQLTGAATRWATIEREAYAVIYALKKLRPYLYGSKFTIYTDHKPLKSLFLSEVKNTKIQRWAVLLAEYGAPIEYRKGPNNIRADMLSRIKPREDILRDSEQMCAVEEEEDIPWEFDQLEKEVIGKEQRQMEQFQLGMEDEEGYAVHNGLLYTLTPPPGKPEYPRLVLPPSARFRVIRRAHAEVGHQGMRKTLDRIQEAYKWPGMRKDVYITISKCAKCAVHHTRKERVAPTAMPIAHYPSQIVGMDMCGPFPESKYGNRYILTLIDHCTGWVEVKPLPFKTAENVVKFLSSEYVPRYGPPEIMITDQGLEFKNREVESYLKSIGVEVRHSSPFHPQTNGKIERFHRTFKGILRKFVNARPGEWEEHIGPTVWAHRVSTSTVTGYTPYFLTFGRKPKVPFSRIFPGLEGTQEQMLSTRLQELTNAFREAAVRTEQSRQYNYRRIQERAKAGDLRIGDSIIVLANESAPLDPKWDHGYMVVGIRGSVITALGPKNKRRVVNREKVRLVSGEVDWDTLRVRQTRAQRGRKRVHSVVKPSISGPQAVTKATKRACHGHNDDLMGNGEALHEGQGIQRSGTPPDPPTECSNQNGGGNIPLPGNSDRPEVDHPHQIRPGAVTRSLAYSLQEAGSQKRTAQSPPRDLKRQRHLAPPRPNKRSLPDPEEVLEGKRRCIEFVCSFFSTLPPHSAARK